MDGLGHMCPSNNQPGTWAQSNRTEAGMHFWQQTEGMNERMGMSYSSSPLQSQFPIG